jgi:hypothetical protein
LTLLPSLPSFRAQGAHDDYVKEEAYYREALAAEIEKLNPTDPQLEGQVGGSV